MPADDPTRTLSTERLTLRPFAMDDAPEIARLLDDPRVADVLVELPRPYGVDDARAWIESHEPARRRDACHAFATCLRDGTLVGAIELRRSVPRDAPGYGRGELGYWTGPEHRYPHAGSVAGDGDPAACGASRIRESPPPGP